MTNHTIPDAALSQHIAILGKTGSGKTSTAKLAVEQVVAGGARVCVLDPIKSDWWGLTLNADGKRAGLPFHILGGPYGHVPLHAEAGKAIAEVVANGALPLSIIDMSDFPAPADLAHFFTDFAPTLIRKMRGVLYLVIEEAHEFCLSDDTEILTKNGFCHHREIDVGTEAVCFDTSNGRFSYGPVERVIRRDWSGEMVRLQSDGLDSFSTPDHRVVLRRVQRGRPERYKLYDWTFCQADKVPTCVCIPVGGAPIGQGIADLTIEEARILGWIITDGNFHPAQTVEPRIMLCQSTSTTKMGKSILAEMDAALACIEGISRYERAERVSVAMGRPVRSGRSVNWYFGGNSSRRFVHLLEGELHRIPRRIIEQASRQQLEALFLGLLEGDGTSLNGRWVRFYPGHNSGLADDFQEVAIRLGIAATKQVATNGQWIVNIANERRMNWVRKPSREHYEGVVWDVTVPTGAFVARRNGKVFVTGNCPKERAGFGNENMSIHWAKKLATAGRSKGIRLIVATQRVQSLHNAVLGSCETIIAHRLTTPADQKPVNGWLKANVDKDVQEKVAASLSSLPTGTGWLCSGEARIFEQRAFPRIKTYDNSATPTGDGDRRDVRPAPVDQDKLRAIIGTAVAEAEANDPEALKAEIAKLRADLAKKPGTASGVVEKINTADLKAAKDTAFASGRATGLKDGYLRGFDEGWTDGQNATTNAFLASINNFAAIAQGVPHKTKMPKVRVPDDLLSAANQVAPIGTNPRTNYAPVAQRSERTAHNGLVAGSNPAGRSNGDTSLSSAQLKVLHALAWWRAMGHDTASRVQVATICRWRSTSSNIRDRSSELKGLGLIEYVGTGETLRLTDAGAAAAPEPDMTADLVTGIRSILSSAQLKVFDALYSNTDPMQRAEIAALVGWSADSSNIRDRCSELVSLEICRYPSPGVVALQDWVRG